MYEDDLAVLLLDASPMMIELWDDDLNIIGCNKRLLDTFGLTSKEEYFSRYFEFSPKFQPCGTSSEELSDLLMREVFATGSMHCEWMHLLPDGEELPVEVFAKKVTHQGKTLMVEYMKDMREKRLSENLLSAVIKSAEALLTANKDNTVSALMQGMKIVGECLSVDRVQIWRNEIIDNKMHFVMRYKWLSEIGKQKIEVPVGFTYPYKERNRWLEMFSNNEVFGSAIENIPPQDAAFLRQYEMLSIVCLPLFLNNELIGFFSIDDCTKSRTFSKDEMGIIASAGLMFTSFFNRIAQEDLILTDALTGLKNKRYIMEVIEQKYQESIRDNTEYSVIMTDIDHFKKVNDKYGHSIGDDVLRIFAARIKNALKSGTCIARYGGEEFLVALPKVGHDYAVKAAWRLNKTISSSKFVINDLTIPITASFGVASKTNDTQTLLDVINDSDKALYEAKNSGRNTVVG